MSAADSKVDVRPEWWDNIFAPSSCLVLITTVDRDGAVNAAAFGTCTRVCHDPVYIAFTCGTGKDTYGNVLATGEFVVNVVPFEQPMLDRTLVCGLPFRAGINELEKAGLTAIPARTLKPPRIAECRSHFECRVAWTQHWVNRLMGCGTTTARTRSSATAKPGATLTGAPIEMPHAVAVDIGGTFTDLVAYDHDT